MTESERGRQRDRQIEEERDIEGVRKNVFVISLRFYLLLFI